MCVNYRIHSFRMIHLHSSTTRQPQIQFTHGNYVNDTQHQYLPTKLPSSKIVRKETLACNEPSLINERASI